MSIFVNQRGAGCGKTYESVQLLRADSRFSSKTVFIYLTKQHSAKDVINFEHKSQLGRFEIVDESLARSVKSKNKGKQYVFQYPDGKMVVIGTVDSFIFALGNGKTPRSSTADYFQLLARTVVEGYKAYDDQNRLRYAGQHFQLGKSCLIVIDETQDLTVPEQDLAFERIVADTGTDVYLIGDKLQSIWGSDNMLVRLSNKHSPNVICNTGANIVKRFHNAAQMRFVNAVVPFFEFGLPEITGICDGKDCSHPHGDEKVETFGMAGPKKEEEDAEVIVGLVAQAVEKYGYKPENFMFIFPILTKNDLVHVLHRALKEFWYQKQGPEAGDNPVVLHQSQENQPIDLTTSEHSARILSIHAAKGQGREVVFVIGLNVSALEVFLQGRRDDLMLHSLIHVALTRHKRKLFIGINGDDWLTRRIAGALVAADLRPSKGSCFESCISSKKLTQSVMGNKDTLSTVEAECFSNEFVRVANICSKQEQKGVIEWGDHVMRYSAFYYLLLFRLCCSDLDSLGQVGKLMKKVFKAEPVIVERREYEKILKTKQDWRRKPERWGDLDKDFRVPVIRYPNPRSQQIAEVFLSIVKRVRTATNRITKGEMPCVMEVCTLHHVLQVVNGISPDTHIDSFYNLIEVFATPRRDDGVCVECRRQMTDRLEKAAGPVTNDKVYEHFSTAFGRFYETVDHLALSVKGLGYKWNVSHSVVTGPVPAGVKTRFVATADSGEEVIAVYIKPTLSALNLSEFLTQTAVDSWVLRNPEDKATNSHPGRTNTQRFKGKKIKICVLTCSSACPVWIDLAQQSSAQFKNILTKIIFAHSQHTVDKWIQHLEAHSKLPDKFPNGFPRTTITLQDAAETGVKVSREELLSAFEKDIRCQVANTC